MIALAPLVLCAALPAPTQDSVRIPFPVEVVRGPDDSTPVPDMWVGAYAGEDLITEAVADERGVARFALPTEAWSQAHRIDLYARAVDRAGLLQLDLSQAVLTERATLVLHRSSMRRCTRSRHARNNWCG